MIRGRHYSTDDYKTVLLFVISPSRIAVNYMLQQTQKDIGECAQERLLKENIRYVMIGAMIDNFI
jgi:hypothetical protein